MDRVIDIALIPTTPIRGAGDQMSASENPPHIVTAVRSPITRAEFAAAGLIGIAPTMTVTLACSDDYNGEQFAIINGARYHIYRTYETKSGGIELYLERRAGDRQTRIMR